jgi:DNA-binding transcriptional regulator YiaG
MQLRNWRKQWGLTQGQLARLLGVRLITVARWEWGTRRIPPFLYLALKALEYQVKEGEGHDYFRIMAATGHKTMSVFKRTP